MTEVFVPLDLEQHASERARLLHEIEADFIDNLTRIYQRTAYELSEQGWTLHQIGDELSCSLATVRHLIAAHAAAEGRISPLRSQRTGKGVLDIRGLVQRRATPPQGEDQPAGAPPQR